MGHDVDVINTVNYASMYIHEGNMLSVNDFRVMTQGLLKAIAKAKGSGVVGGHNDEVATQEHDVPVLISGKARRIR